MKGFDNAILTPQEAYEQGYLPRSYLHVILTPIDLRPQPTRRVWNF